MIGQGLAGFALAVAAAVVCAQSASATAAGGAAAAPQAAPQAETLVAPQATSQAADGRRVYTSFCVRCHGINLVASSSAYFDLRTFPRDDKERFVRSVSKGLRAMPAWEGTIKPEQIEAIWAYIGSVNGWAPGDSPK